eukprot:648106-Alexandrium_andersonii.AAC.1
MSASLVGSEMCIRDSARSASWKLRAQRAGPPQHVVQAASGGRDEREGADCLLYTSDAADDM